MARAQVRASPFGVIVIDVDDFKDYNDRFGHLSGDTPLRAAAHALASATREHDTQRCLACVPNFMEVQALHKVWRNSYF